MSNVVNLAQRRRFKERESVVRCTECGSDWWIVAAVRIEQNATIGGWTGVPQCRECGHFQVVSR